MNRSVLAALLAFALALSIGGKDANAEEAKKDTTEKAGTVASTVEKERKEFVAAAERDLRELKAEMHNLKKKAAAAAGDERVKLTEQTKSIDKQLKVASRKLTELKSAAPEKWRELKTEVAGAIDHLKQSLGIVKGDQSPRKGTKARQQR